MDNNIINLKPDEYNKIFFQIGNSSSTNFKENDKTNNNSISCQTESNGTTITSDQGFSIIQNKELFHLNNSIKFCPINSGKIPIPKFPLLPESNLNLILPFRKVKQCIQEECYHNNENQKIIMDLFEMRKNIIENLNLVHIPLKRLKNPEGKNPFSLDEENFFNKQEEKTKISPNLIKLARSGSRMFERESHSTFADEMKSTYKDKTDDIHIWDKDEFKENSSLTLQNHKIQSKISGII